jgi:tetratricopeptide (TPR) repeat protein
VNFVESIALTHRYLVGPVTVEFADQNLYGQRQAGDCLAFDYTGNTDLAICPTDTWESVCARLPSGWQPDFVVLHLPYTTIPKCLWSAPVPLVGLAGDWNLLWHGYRRRLHRCDLVLTDTAGVEALSREGIEQIRVANLFGCERSFVEVPSAEGPRDIDILFIGNMHPAVQRERMPWVARLARLAERWRVLISTGVFDADYRALMSRARIAFNRSIRGECNLRVFEAAAMGALLFQEAGNREVPGYFTDKRECVYYDEANLESLLEYYLEHEDERRRLAEAARARVQQYSFEALWEDILGLVEREWAGLMERARRRPNGTVQENLVARCWQAFSSTHAGDPALVHDLTMALEASPAGSEPSAGNAAALHNALGLVRVLASGGQGLSQTAVAEAASGHFRRALGQQPSHVLAGLNLAEALVAAGQDQAALQQARRTLSIVDHRAKLDLISLDGGHFPPVYDLFRVEWERAAWEHAGQPAAEAAAKRQLLRWRLHALLADLTGDVIHRYEAVLARPDLPSTRIDLGCDLARAKRFSEAIPHLRQAVADLPFEPDAPRVLFQALGAISDISGQDRLARDRRLLARAAPQLVPVEPWFADASLHAAGSEPTPMRPLPGTGVSSAYTGRVSLCMIVKNEETNLPACLESAADLVDEIIVVDTGSTDGTKEVAGRFGARLFDFGWVDSFAAARNESLGHATGDWIFWLDADDRLNETNRGRLRALFASLRDENIAHVMKCACLPDAETGSVTVVDHVRLFRKHPDLRWKYRVHEQILPAVRRLGGDVRWSEVVIQHTGYQDPGLRRRKLERDLHLLHLDNAEYPDEPFVLFNLGSVYLELGRPAEALPFLQRSLELSHPGDSIVRKLYALLAQGHGELGQSAQALEACRQGRSHYPDDTELLFREGMLLRGLGDWAGAEACLRRLVESQPDAHFASVDAGLHGYKARHNLAEIYGEQGRLADAEAQWRAAVAEQPGFLPAWHGLGELYLAQGRWDELEQVAGRLEAWPQAEVEAALLRARGRLARKEFATARQLLEQTIARAPEALGPRLYLSHTLLQEGVDWPAAERALRDVLALDPGHVQTRHNLAVLCRQQQKTGQ